MSGISNFQSGPLLTSLLSPNFGLYGSLTLPVGTTATTPISGNTSTCPANTTTNTCSLQLSNYNLLGTPDIAVQPIAVGSLRGSTNHQYINGSTFRLPTLGTNGPTYYGNLRGPAFFNTDAALRKEFHVSDKNRLQFRLAAFNAINHANSTFSNLYPGSYSLNFTQTQASQSLGMDLATATNQQSGFGSVPLRTGRRVMEVSVKYVF
ncbi:MAG: hypothetical protein ACRYFU_05355 [Janthinobacterium lividum]